MARITPKTNWVASDIPVATDFNRIENNSEQAFTELEAEAANRTAAINAEANSRILGDKIFQSQSGSVVVKSSDGESSTLSTSFINAFTTTGLKAEGVINVFFEYSHSGSIGFSEFRILKNGTQIGPTFSSSSALYQNASLDVNISVNDIIAIEYRKFSGDGSAKIRNRRIRTLALNTSILADAIFAFL